jgi:hypothetical protein
MIFQATMTIWFKNSVTDFVAAGSVLLVEHFVLKTVEHKINIVPYKKYYYGMNKTMV